MILSPVDGVIEPVNSSDLRHANVMCYSLAPSLLEHELRRNAVSDETDSGGGAEVVTQ